MTPAEFKKKWARYFGKEISAYQEHFNDTALDSAGVLVSLLTRAAASLSVSKSASSKMLNWLAAVAIATSAVAQDDLPKREGDDSLDVEPPLLIKDGKPLAPLPAPDDSVRDPEQLQAALDRAKRSAAAGERQFKAGIIAKVQVEERALKVVRLEADLANARLQLAKDEHAARQERSGTGEITRAELDAAALELANATEAARIANENRERAEVEAAQTNLRRQQKLLAVGSAHKADVNRAEAKLSELIRQR